MIQIEAAGIIASSRAIVGSAMFAIVPSSTAMNATIIIVLMAQRRCGVVKSGGLIGPLFAAYIFGTITGFSAERVRRA